MRTAVALIFATTTASVSAAQPSAGRSGDTADTLRLSVDAARSLALRQNRELSAARVGIDVARGQLRQAGTIRTNPLLDVLTTGSTGAKPEVSLSQEIELGGQRGLRRRSAEAELSRVGFTTADVARLTIAEVDRAFYQLFASDRRVELSRDILALNERLSDVARRQLAEGEISKLDFNLAVIELGRSRARSVSVVRERDATDLELRRLLALDQRTVIRPVVDSTHRHVALDSTGAIIQVAAPSSLNGTPLQELVARALGNRPDLRARDATTSRAAADVLVAEREAIPNLVPRLSTETTVGGSAMGVRPGIGLSLPFFNRNRGAVDARRAAVLQAQLDHAATAARVRSEVESAVRAYNAGTAAVEVLESTVLVPARENRILLEAAYREGKVGLPVLLLIRNQVIDAEQEYWSAWLAERQAFAALSAALGDNISLPPGARP